MNSYRDTTRFTGPLGIELDFDQRGSGRIVDKIKNAIEKRFGKSEEEKAAARLKQAKEFAAALKARGRGTVDEEIVKTMFYSRPTNGKKLGGRRK